MAHTLPKGLTMQTKTRILTTIGAAVTVLAVGFIPAATASPAPAAHSAVAKVVPAVAVTVGPLEFVPISPCRVANTHFAATQLIPVNGTRSFYVRGTTGFSAQGGESATGCNIPDAAASIVTTVNATASTVLPIYNSGYLQGYPSNELPTKANFLAFKKGGTSGNPTLTLAPAGIEPSLKIKSLGGATEIAIDVTGYYIAPIAVVIAGGNGTILPSVLSGNVGSIVGVTRSGAGSYLINTDRDVSGCTPVATPSTLGLSAVTTIVDSTHIKVTLQNLLSLALGDGTFALNVIC